MLSSIKDFICRHKKKIIVVGVVVSGAVIGSQYAQRKLIEWQEKETKEFLERTRKQHYFESTEKTCNQTIIFLAATLRENVCNLVNCEQVIQKLREGSSNKVELWQELKVLVFTKVALLIYSGTLLVIAIRIQLNIIGGHIYSKSQLPENTSKGANALQEEYLSQCHYFLNNGLEELYPLVKEKVCIALKDITLKQNLTLQSLENIFWAIQSSITSDSRNPLNLMPQFLYGGSNFKNGNAFIEEMMLDTVDLLQSTEVLDLASSCINQGFASIIDKIAEFFTPDNKTNGLIAHPSTSKDVDNYIKFSHPASFSKPLAKVIPIVNGIGNPGPSNEITESWISPFIYMERVKLLGANIFESYSCPKN